MIHTRFFYLFCVIAEVKVSLVITVIVHLLKGIRCEGGSKKKLYISDIFLGNNKKVNVRTLMYIDYVTSQPPSLSLYSSEN